MSDLDTSHHKTALSLAELTSRKTLTAQATHCGGWLLLTYVCLSLFYGLGEGDLDAWDEGLYGWRAKVAAVNGDWLDQIPHSYNTFYSGVFPPLLVWKMGLSMSIFGLEEWAVRLPSAMMGAGGVLALYFIGRAFAGHGLGVLIAIFYGTIGYIVRYSRRAQFDVPFTSWMLITSALYFWRMKRPERRWLFLVLTGLALGCGLMTKIAIPAFALIIIFFWQLMLLLHAWRFNDARWLNPLAPQEFAGKDESENSFTPQKMFSAAKTYLIDHIVVTGIAFVVWAPWHVLMTFKHGKEFWDWYIGYHLLSRNQNVLDFHDGGWDFYPYSIYDRLPTYLYALAFISVLMGFFWVVSGLVKGSDPTTEATPYEPKESSADRTKFNPRSLLPGMLWAVAWFVILGGIFQTATTKREIYMIPIYAILAVFGGIYFYRWLGRPPRWWFHWLIAFPGLFFVLELSDGGARRDFAWDVIIGEHELQPGQNALVEVVQSLSPFIGTAYLMAGVALIVMAAVGFGLSGKLSRKRTDIMGLVGSVVLIIAVLTTGLAELKNPLEPDDLWYRREAIAIRDIVDDKETWPKVAFLGYDHNLPSTMYYFYGAVRDSKPIDARPVTYYKGAVRGMLEEFKQLGALIIMERGFPPDPEQRRVLNEDLQAFEKFFDEPNNRYLLYRWTP